MGQLAALMAAVGGGEIGLPEPDAIDEDLAAARRTCSPGRPTIRFTNVPLALQAAATLSGAVKTMMSPRSAHGSNRVVRFAITRSETRDLQP